MNDEEPSRPPRPLHIPPLWPTKHTALCFTIHTQHYYLARAWKRPSYFSNDPVLKRAVATMVWCAENMDIFRGQAFRTENAQGNWFHQKANKANERPTTTWKKKNTVITTFLEPKWGRTLSVSLPGWRPDVYITQPCPNTYLESLY